jgi:hypothetical protein
MEYVFYTATKVDAFDGEVSIAIDDKPHNNELWVEVKRNNYPEHDFMHLTIDRTDLLKLISALQGVAEMMEP